MGQGRLTHIVTHTILTSFSTFSRGKIEKCDLFKEIKNETVAYSVLPKQARYQLRYTRIWNFPIVVKHVVNADFWPVTGDRESAVSPNVPRLSGFSEDFGSNPSLTLPKQARYQLRYTRIS